MWSFGVVCSGGYAVPPVPPVPPVRAQHTHQSTQATIINDKSNVTLQARIHMGITRNYGNTTFRFLLGIREPGGSESFMNFPLSLTVFDAPYVLSIRLPFHLSLFLLAENGHTSFEVFRVRFIAYSST